MVSSFQIKTRVWFEDRALSWTEGEISEVLEEGKKILVSTVHGSVICPSEKVHIRNDEKMEACDNLMDLVFLDEPNVLFPSSNFRNLVAGFINDYKVLDTILCF